MATKYGASWVGASLTQTKKPKPSYIWRGLIWCLKSVIPISLRWNIRDGNMCNFWTDWWLGMDRCLTKAWDTLRREPWIAGIRCNDNEDSSDNICWSGTSSGDYTVASAFKLPSTQRASVEDSSLRIIKRIW
ncbi:hypothetical protein V2J09_013098 [Rumex salicifolius]